MGGGIFLVFPLSSHTLRFRFSQDRLLSKVSREKQKEKGEDVSPSARGCTDIDFCSREKVKSQMRKPPSPSLCESLVSLHGLQTKGSGLTVVYRRCFVFSSWTSSSVPFS